MTKNALWFITVLVVALVQTTWPDLLKFEKVSPDLILLIVIYFAIVEGEERAMFSGVLGGAYEDVASNSLLGHHILALVVVGYAVGRFSMRLVTEHPAVKVGLVFAAALAHGLLYTAILDVLKPEVSFLYTVATAVVPGAFYTALLTPIMFLIFTWIFRRKESASGGIS